MLEELKIPYEHKLLGVFSLSFQYVSTLVQRRKRCRTQEKRKGKRGERKKDLHQDTYLTFLYELIPNPPEFSDRKKTLYEKFYVNGRVPAIEDPNTGITLWESGAIVEYLQETYDEKNALTYTSLPEKFLVKQWLHFQVCVSICILFFGFGFGREVL